MNNRKGLAVCVEIYLIGKYWAKGSSNYRKQEKKKENFVREISSFCLELF
jgi:hypothetical protein